MGKKTYIWIVFLVFSFYGMAQEQTRRELVQIKGSVKGKENYMPVPGVEVSTDTGYYTTTNGQGEFVIRAAIGDMLIFESQDFETVRHQVTSDEDIVVYVKGYEASRSQKKSKRTNTVSKPKDSHHQLLDSANAYKRSDLEKSVDFITQSIVQLGKRADRVQLSNSLFALGEIYLYHAQYDLAISSLKDALAARRTAKTELLLGQAYNLNNQYDLAESTLLPLVDVNGLVPYQRVQINEGLGDAYKGQGDVAKALDYYQEGLQIAQKNQISPKVIDLNSKIADAYASDNRIIEAEGFFNNSLNLSKEVAPERQIQENEKVADFYNEKNRYDDEIQLRKQSLNELQQLPAATVNKSSGDIGLPDTITSQQINYKIGRAYIAQDKLDEAIPYLQRSIVEADNEDDLVVQKDATRRLSEVYKYKGDFTKALETYQDYVAVVDSLYARKEQEISRAARFNREIATQQNRISTLEQERELSQSKYSLAVTEQQLYEESSKRQKWIIYSLLFGMMLLALMAFLFYRTNQQQKLANNLLALKSLRTQMNPHFIFNALNSVNNFIAKSDERSANRFLSDFSVLMRSVLENSEEDFIPLSKELELLELYVKLEHSRFEDKFDYQIGIDQKLDIEAFSIPPMLLQPYLENAIWHGLRYKEEKGFLNINIQEATKDVLEISIEDNGIGRKKSAALKTENQKKQKSKGMGNIKKRIQILNEMYKDKVAVSISDLNDDTTGTKVVLKLKKDAWS